MAREVVRNVNGVQGREPWCNHASHESDALQLPGGVRQAAAGAASATGAPAPVARPPRLDGVNLDTSFRGLRNGSDLLIAQFPRSDLPSVGHVPERPFFVHKPRPTKIPSPQIHTVATRMVVAITRLLGK
jgi:hypothetical protein